MKTWWMPRQQPSRGGSSSEVTSREARPHSRLSYQPLTREPSASTDIPPYHVSKKTHSHTHAHTHTHTHTHTHSKALGSLFFPVHSLHMFACVNLVIVFLVWIKLPVDCFKANIHQRGQNQWPHHS